MNRISGKYHYRSFCPQARTRDSPPEIAAPWTPPGELTAESDGAGKITGKLSFGPGRELQIAGAITPAAGLVPEGIQLTGTGMMATYAVRGFFVEGSNHLVGTILAVENDVAGKPAGTQGPFILFPA